MPLITLKDANQIAQDAALLLAIMCDHFGVDPSTLSTNVEGVRNVSAQDLGQRIRALNDQIEEDDKIIYFPLAKQNNNTTPAHA